MKRALFPSVVFLLVATLTSCLKRKVHYECQCYSVTDYTSHYIGRVPGDAIAGICLDIQHKNNADTCYGSGSLK